MSKWKKMDTAPPDRAVLVCGTPYKNRWQMVCIGVFDGCEWWKADDMFGWHDFDETEPGATDSLEDVTHWMPLPVPPDDAEK